MVSLDRATKALTYLVESDESHAMTATELDSAKRDLDDNDRAYKNAIKKAMLMCEGTVSEKEGKALDRGEVDHYLKRHTKLREEHEKLLGQYNKVKYKRGTEDLVLRLYQTHSANLRQGKV